MSCTCRHDYLFNVRTTHCKPTCRPNSLICYIYNTEAFLKQCSNTINNDIMYCTKIQNHVLHKNTKSGSPELKYCVCIGVLNKRRMLESLNIHLKWVGRTKLNPLFQCNRSVNIYYTFYSYIQPDRSRQLTP